MEIIEDWNRAQPSEVRDLPKSKGVARITIQIALAVAAFVLTVETVLYTMSVDDRRQDMEYLREYMYGKAVSEPVVDMQSLLSDREIDRFMAWHRRQLFWGVIAVLVVVVGGTVLIVHWRAVVPIRQILDHNRDSMHGSIQFIPREKFPRNEMGWLMHSQNLMLYSLLQAYKEEAIQSLVTAVDAKDRYTYGHSRRVGHYGAVIAKAIGLPDGHVGAIRQSGELHDIGKIAIPETILNANRKLTDEEWEMMKKHPRRGEAMLRFSTFPEEVRLGALTHHENWDGSGYPSGLRGEEIPLVGRILHIADALDAMTSERPYRKAMEMDYVVDEFIRCRGKMFDPKITDTFLNLLQRGKIKVGGAASAAASDSG